MRTRALAPLLLSTALLAAPAEWKDAPRVSPEELVPLLKAPEARRPAVIQVGFKVLFVQAHISGSTFAGPGRDAAGLDALRKAVAGFPKGKAIVLYCGCCPWSHCPNMRPAYEALREAGYTNVKLLYVPQNLGADWVKKGYPTATGDVG